MSGVQEMTEETKRAELIRHLEYLIQGKVAQIKELEGEIRGLQEAKVTVNARLKD